MALNRGKSSGWEDLDLESSKKVMTRGLLIDIVGAEGVGKTTLALTLARMGRVGYVDIDQSIDRAMKPEGKKMKGRIKTLPVRYAGGVTGEVSKSEANEAWSALESGVSSAASDWADGVIIDTGTEAWELLRLGSFGTLTPKGRTEKLYGEVNAKFRQMLRNVYRGHRKHLVTIHQVKDEYIEKISSSGEKVSARTGKMKEACMKEVPYLSDIRILVHRKKAEFKATFEMCKLDPSLEGIEIEGEDVNIPNIVAMATGTDESDWLR